MTTWYSKDLTLWTIEAGQANSMSDDHLLNALPHAQGRLEEARERYNSFPPDHPRRVRIEYGLQRIDECVRAMFAEIERRGLERDS